MTKSLYENWAEGSTYEHFMGRWSAEIAVVFLDWLKIKPDGN